MSLEAESLFFCINVESTINIKFQQVEEEMLVSCFKLDVKRRTACTSCRLVRKVSYCQKVFAFLQYSCVFPNITCYQPQPFLAKCMKSKSENWFAWWKYHKLVNLSPVFLFVSGHLSLHSGEHTDLFPLPSDSA